MPIPDFQTLMLPLLKLAGDKQEHSFKETIPFLANQFNLTFERINTGSVELNEMEKRRGSKPGKFLNLIE